MQRHWSNDVRFDLYFKRNLPPLHVSGEQLSSHSKGYAEGEHTVNPKLPGSNAPGWKNREMTELEPFMGASPQAEMKKQFHDRIRSRTLDPEGRRIYDSLTAELEGMAYRCIDLLPDGRHLRLALSHLEDALLHIQQAID